MAKKRKAMSAKDEAALTPSSVTEEEERTSRQGGENKEKASDDHSDSDSDGASSSDDSLLLEGVLMRNPDFSESDGDDDGDGDGSDISSEEEAEQAPRNDSKSARETNAASFGDGEAKASNRGRQLNNNERASPEPKRPKKRSNEPEPEMIQVEFLFCDMQERFFHGMKTLLHRHGLHAPHSSPLADLVIANKMVGTVLSSDVDSVPSGADSAPPADAEEQKKKKKKKKPSSSKSDIAIASSLLPLPRDDANVFGFASVVNVTTNHSSPTIQSLKSTCLKHCPSQHKAEMEVLLSGRTKRPAGFFFQERMVNVPLEIIEVLHQQLVLDMDHAVAHAADEAERKSLDFGAFLRLAPCYKGGGGSLIYKYFDDEVFASNAEFVFELPMTSKGDDDDMRCNVIVMTKTGHRGAMKELHKMIHGN